MRTIILLTLATFSMSAQTFRKDGDLILPKPQIQKIADSLRKHEKCEPAKQKLLRIIREQDLSLIRVLDSLEVLRQERDNLYEEGLKLQFDAGQLNEANKWYRNRWLWMGIGAAFGGWMVNYVKSN